MITEYYEFFFLGLIFHFLEHVQQSLLECPSSGSLEAGWCSASKKSKYISRICVDSIKMNSCPFQSGVLWNQLATKWMVEGMLPCQGTEWVFVLAVTWSALVGETSSYWVQEWSLCLLPWLFWSRIHCYKLGMLTDRGLVYVNWLIHSVYLVI